MRKIKVRTFFLNLDTIQTSYNWSRVFLVLLSRVNRIFSWSEIFISQSLSLSIRSRTSLVDKEEYFFSVRFLIKRSWLSVVFYVRLFIFLCRDTSTVQYEQYIFTWNIHAFHFCSHFFCHVEFHCRTNATSYYWYWKIHTLIHV